MASVGVNHRFIELGHSRGKVLRIHQRAQIVESPRGNRTASAARETKLRQSCNSGWISIRNANGVREVAYGRIERDRRSDQLDAIFSESNLIQQIGGQRMAPVNASVIEPGFA